MLNPDPRGYRVAVVADAVANGPGVDDIAVVDLLAALDYGMIVPPPDDFEIPTIDRIVEYLADDVLDYRGSGYHVVMVARGDRPAGGVWLDRFEAEWARRSVEALPVLDVLALDAAGLRAALDVAPTATVAPAGLSVVVAATDDARPRFEAFLSRLIAVAAERPDVVGLVAFGSTADRSRVDSWSDHDFAWVTEPGAEDRYRHDLSWLPDPGRIVVSVVEGHGGVKAMYDDGHVLEFGIATIDGLGTWWGDAVEVLVDTGGVAEAVAALVERTAARRPIDAASAVRLMLTQLLIGAGRARRGELLSARRLVVEEAVTLLVAAVNERIPVAGHVANGLDPRRRFDAAHPDLSRRLEAAARLDVVSAARAVVDIAEDVLAPGWPDFPHAGLAAVRRAPALARP